MPVYSKGIHFVYVNWSVSKSRYRIQPTRASTMSVETAPYILCRRSVFGPGMS